MDYKEMLKKYWFAGVIAIFLIAGLVYFTNDLMKDQVKGLKTDDGKDVVFTYDGQHYTADELYDEVYDGMDVGVILPLLELEIYRDADEVTKAMEEDAKANTEQLITNLKMQVGENWEKALDQLLIQEGYTAKKGEAGLLDLFTILEVRSKVERDYLLNHKELYEPFVEENEPRLVSHILVKMEDPDNPTEDETAKLEEVKEALAKEGAVFSDVAAQYSDDNSKENGGSLGMVTKESNEQFVENFKNKTYTLKTGETSEWFKTEYGYHIMKIDATTVEEFLELDNYSIFNEVFKADPKIKLAITWDQIEKQDIKFGEDEALNKALKEHYTGKGE